MSDPHARLKIVLLGGILLIGLVFVYGLSVRPSLAQSSRGQTDSTTVARLSATSYETHPTAEGDPNGTLAAVLAAELLLTPIDYSSHLPLIVK